MKNPHARHCLFSGRAGGFRMSVRSYDAMADYIAVFAEIQLIRILFYMLESFQHGFEWCPAAVNAESDSTVFVPHDSFDQ